MQSAGKISKTMYHDMQRSYIKQHESSQQLGHSVYGLACTNYINPNMDE